LRENGFAVQEENLPELSELKTRHQVPPVLQSCHTAIVNGYVIEGHVPAAEIDRLLTEKPAIAGLAVPGMPIGSPGMEVAGMDPEPYDVIAFDAQGEMSVFASYPPTAEP
jgi:hypothetical protein